MKKAVVILVAVSVLLSGCGKAKGISQPETVTLSEYQMLESVPVSATLYYPSSDYSHMLAFTQTFPKSASIAENVASALISGTSNGFISPFPKGTQCRSISLVQNILYIDLSANFSAVSIEQFFGCVSSAVYSFCELPQVDYVNITVEGRQLTVPNTKIPIMLLSKYNGNITDLINRYSAGGTVDSFYACIYEYDSSKHFLLPTVKNITVSDGNYTSALISSMLTYENERSVFPKGLSLASPVSLDGNTLNITFSSQNAWEQTDLWLGFVCCAATLSYLYPNASSLDLKVTDKNNNILYQRKDTIYDCYDLVRSAVDVVVADGEKLAKSSVLVSRSSAGDDLKNFTNRYLETTNPDFANTSLVNDVSITGDTVIIDLSKEYFDYYSLKSVSSAEEHTIIFSLICTLCNYTSAKKVMILQNNQVRSRFLNSIVLSYPLVTLPGSYIESLTQ